VLLYELGKVSGLVIHRSAGNDLQKQCDVYSEGLYCMRVTAGDIPWDGLEVGKFRGEGNGNPWNVGSLLHAVGEIDSVPDAAMHLAVGTTCEQRCRIMLNPMLWHADSTPYWFPSQCEREF
jgi:hypothetical protein